MVQKRVSLHDSVHVHQDPLLEFPEFEEVVGAHHLLLLFVLDAAQQILEDAEVVAGLGSFKKEVIIFVQVHQARSLNQNVGPDYVLVSVFLQESLFGQGVYRELLRVLVAWG